MPTLITAADLLFDASHHRADELEARARAEGACVEAYRRGASTARVAAALGITRQGAAAMLRRHGVVLRAPGQPDPPVCARCGVVSDDVAVVETDGRPDLVCLACRRPADPPEPELP